MPLLMSENKNPELEIGIGTREAEQKPVMSLLHFTLVTGLETSFY